MKHRMVFVAVSVLVLAALACGSDNSGVKVGTSAGATAVPKSATVYAVGDLVQVKDHTITLNSTTLTGDVLKANFTIENKGKSDLAVSSMLSFSVKDSEGTKLEQQIFDCGAQIDGKVLPGDKIKGDICWKGAKKPVKIYYESSFLSSGAVVWEVK